MFNKHAFNKQLLDWFDSERAEMPVPGRASRDPYAIWVAEVMLQQTQVNSVWPYYRRWMARWPTLKALAAANPDELLKAWEGLGYYNRVRNLHKGAQALMDKPDGQMPQHYGALLQVTGIGPYTAAAIASMAFGEAVALVDGNVIRVFSRLLRLEGEKGSARLRQQVHEQVSSLISPQRPGDFNQALMDLGRVICSPRKPDCEGCPLNTFCLARIIGDVEDFPVKAVTRLLPQREIVIGLIHKAEQVLIQKRPNRGLLGGLWEFPAATLEAGENPENSLQREIRAETGLKIRVTEQIGSIRHAYTHFKITMTAYHCTWLSGEAQCFTSTENRWVSLEDLDDYAFPKAIHKILSLVRKQP